jgi:ABC-2 type transport system ATP-binding protein
MRQRLALACALVGRPADLVLDEPMNGLDPEGIGWLRQLLSSLARAGAGVFVSTHLVGEVADIADNVVVIDRGRIVAAGSKELLLGGGKPETVARSNDNERLGRALAGHGIGVGGDGPFLRCACPSDTVGRVALEQGIVLAELRPVRTDLRDFVLDHTHGEFRAKAAVAGMAGGDLVAR